MTALAQQYGPWPVALSTKAGATTAATTNCGKISIKRYPDVITIPTLGSGVTAAYLTDVGIGTVLAGSTTYVGYEQLLGSLTVSGNVFSAGTAMPTRTIAGASVVTATLSPILVATTALTATTPVVTITYTNQAGTGSRTATLTLPTNPAINTGFLITPHLQSGDTGIRSVENISISTGTAGVLRVYGLFPQAININSAGGSGTTVLAINSPIPMWPFLGGDSVSVVQFSNTAAADCHVAMCFVGDN